MWGFVFDVVFLGLFFSYYQHRQERRHDIKRWKEEIDDYRYWKTDEAAIRLAGLTRRLANNNASDVDLSHCEIISGVFEGLKLDRYGCISNLRGLTQDYVFEELSFIAHQSNS